MAGLVDKIKEAAQKAGQAASKDPRVQKAAQNIKDTVESFKEGYRQPAEPERFQSSCRQCHKPLPKSANFCPHCGARVA